MTVLVGRKAPPRQMRDQLRHRREPPAVPEETPVSPAPVKSATSTPYTTTPYIKAAPFSTQTPLARTPVVKTNPNPSLIVDYSQSNPSQAGAGLASNAVAGPPSVTVVSGQTAEQPGRGRADHRSPRAAHEFSAGAHRGREQPRPAKTYCPRRPPTRPSYPR